MFLQDGIEDFAPPANQAAVGENMFFIVLGRVREEVLGLGASEKGDCCCDRWVSLAKGVEEVPNECGCNCA